MLVVDDGPLHTDTDRRACTQENGNGIDSEAGNGSERSASDSDQDCAVAGIDRESETDSALNRANRACPASRDHRNATIRRHLVDRPR
jgi:hypothetical protein